MPIYEFYCPKCNTLYSFLSKTIQPDKRPHCPRCKRPRLERQVSLFAATGRAKESAEGEGDLPPVDEARMERAMESLAGEAEGLDEADPKQAAGLMRKFSKATGLELGSGMQEAMNRLEAGEDPEQIEAELGDRLEHEEPFLTPGREKRAGRKPRPAPQRDATLYEM